MSRSSVWGVPRHMIDKLFSSRRKKMGEAQDIVQGTGASPTMKAPITRANGVIGAIGDIIDDVDRAIEVKQKDLEGEGLAAAAENHTKLGILQAAQGLLRRARVLLEEYGTAKLTEDISDGRHLKLVGDEEELEKADEYDWIEVGDTVTDSDGAHWEILEVDRKSFERPTRIMLKHVTRDLKRVLYDTPELIDEFFDDFDDSDNEDDR